MELFV